MYRRTFMKVIVALGTMLAPATAFAQTKVNFMYTATAPFVTAFVAKDQGFFKKHGVDVELQLAANGSVIIAGVVSGSAQVGLPTPTVAFQAIENGLELRAFAATNIFPDTSSAGLVVGADSGITSAKDLEGKTVGVPGLGGLLDVTMRKWVISNGADLSKSTSSRYNCRRRPMCYAPGKSMRWRVSIHSPRGPSMPAPAS